MLQKLNNYLKEKKHLVIDFERTIAEMEIDWSGWYVGMIEIFNKYDTRHGYEKGKNPHKAYNCLAKLYGETLINEVKIFNCNYELNNILGYKPNPELIDFVRNNKSHNLYIYSSNSRQTVIKGLEEFGILNFFKKIISRDEVTYVKPNPEGFYLIDEFEDNKNLFLMIGDSGSDRDAAKAVGIDFLECNVFEKYSDEE